MIAGPNQHYDQETLRRLLDEDLPTDEADRIEGHLGDCPRCRSKMEKLAGKRQWWNETVDVLSSSTLDAAVNKGDLSASRPVDSSLEWIRPMLDQAKDESEGIGRIDDYSVIEVIGQGGMGVVLRGHDRELNRPVAIKVLSPHLAGVGAARARFMREAQAAAAIVHPSIVPIYSVVPAARLPYLVMPCIGGGNLQQRLDREGPIELGEVLRIGLQVAEGLVAAHRNGVIHRDIKPANILMEEGNGRVLISDFGLARALDDATLTVSGMIAGTPQYMSPEQARGEMIDARSDLFSLGSLLYALSTGRPPYRAESPLAVLRKISETKPKPIHHINEMVPQWFDQLVGSLMTRDVSTRLASAQDAAEMLCEAHAHVRNPAVNGLPDALKTSRSRGLALFGVGAMVLAGLVLIGVIAKSWLPFKTAVSETMSAQSRTDEGSAASNGFVETLATPEFDWNTAPVHAELADIHRTLAALEQEMSDNTLFDTSSNASYETLESK